MKTMPAWKVGLATIALLLASVGIAYATAVLPDQTADEAVARTAAARDGESDGPRGQRRVGPGRDGSVNEAVHAVIEDRDAGGCEFGQAVADAARAHSQSDDAGADDPCDRREDATQGADTREPGHHEREGSPVAGAARAAHPQENRSDDGADDSDDDGDDRGEEGRSRGRSATGSGRDQGQEASDDGRQRDADDDEDEDEDDEDEDAGDE